ncbi:MAG: DedA family protein [Methylococcales bacterium]|nr:DedA family protein [Methylococcales bacterium]
MNDIHSLIASYGQWFYLLAFIWTALEGETFIIFAGFAAQKGYLNIEALFISAWLGSLTGDQLCFFLGRYFGTHFLNHSSSFTQHLNRATHILERYAVLFILGYRFMYGVRNVSSIAIGMSHFSWKRFAFWNVIAAFIWASVFSGFGYFFGDIIDHLPKSVIDLNIQTGMLTILLLFVMILVLRVIIIRIQKRHW